MTRLLKISSACVPATLLSIAGVLKLSDPYYATKFVIALLDSSFPAALFLIRLLGVLEFIVGLTTVLLLGVRRLPAVAALGMYAAFALLIGVLLLREPGAVTCGCFGSLMSRILYGKLPIELLLDLLMCFSLVYYLASFGALRSETEANSVGRRGSTATREQLVK